MRSVAMMMLLLFSAICCMAQDARPYPPPGRFEKAIAQFEAHDAEAPPPEGAIVCIGSSSMRGWHSTIKEDLSPLTVIPRGFGGSNMNELLSVTDRIVLPYKPRAVVVYEGDNDLAMGISPEQFVAVCKSFAEKVHAELPACRIYFLTVKPSISRWKLWPKTQEANRLLAALAASDERLTCIDVATPMLDDAGTPKPEIFKADKLHMTREGYLLWRDAVRPVLLAQESASQP